MTASAPSSSSSSFAVTATIQLRVCERRDLRELEWFGMFTPHRALIEEAFARQLRGEVVMGVADLAGFPVGQVWVDLARKRDQGTGIIWAIRVIPFLQVMT